VKPVSDTARERQAGRGGGGSAREDGTVVAETDRLRIRLLALDDAPFILELLNDPAWLRFIGDRGVRTLDDARDYLRTGPIAMVRELGFGLYLVERRADGAALGICGLLRREWLDAPDLGFAFLPRYRVQGYAFEASRAVLRHGRQTQGLARVLAVTAPDNERAARLLGRLGFRHEAMVEAPGEGSPLRLFACPG